MELFDLGYGFKLQVSKEAERSNSGMFLDELTEELTAIVEKKINEYNGQTFKQVDYEKDIYND